MHVQLLHHQGALCGGRDAIMVQQQAAAAAAAAAGGAAWRIKAVDSQPMGVVGAGAPGPAERALRGEHAEPAALQHLGAQVALPWYAARSTTSVSDGMLAAVGASNAHAVLPTAHVRCRHMPLCT